MKKLILTLTTFIMIFAPTVFAQSNSTGGGPRVDKNSFEIVIDASELSGIRNFNGEYFDEYDIEELKIDGVRGLKLEDGLIYIKNESKIDLYFKDGNSFNLSGSFREELKRQELIEKARALLRKSRN